jgi:hypothetical protein
MKFPVCNGDLPAGGRQTLQIDSDQKNRKNAGGIISLTLPVIRRAGTAPRISQGWDNAGP